MKCTINQRLTGISAGYIVDTKTGKGEFMKDTIIGKIVGFVWIVAGAGKVLGSIAEFATGKPLISPYMTMFADGCIIPAYASFIRTWFVPAALPLILAVAIGEVIAGAFILRRGLTRTLGLVVVILLNIVFMPLLGVFTIVINLVFIGFEVWLLLDNRKAGAGAA